MALKDNVFLGFNGSAARSRALENLKAEVRSGFVIDELYEIRQIIDAYEALHDTAVELCRVMTANELGQGKQFTTSPEMALKLKVLDVCGRRRKWMAWDVEEDRNAAEMGLHLRSTAD